MLEVSPYAYAKACGIIGKSFAAKRFSSLYGLYSLNDLNRLVFPDYFPNLPSGELLPDLENKITMRALGYILSIVDSYSKPPKIIEYLLRSYEYGDLKTCIHAISAGVKELPPVCDIGRFKKINFKAYPDLNKMLKGTEFESALSEELQVISHNMDVVAIESKIDDLFYKGLVKSLDELSYEDYRVLQRLLTDEISLRNCAWALRLRFYYQKNKEDIEKFLTDIRIHGKRKHSLTEDALVSLDFPLDSRSHWETWRWDELLNPEEFSVHWTVNPRFFQNAASNYLYKLSMRYFRRNPMTVSSIFCFIKLVQIEEDILTSIAEGLALGMDSSAVLTLLEVGL